MAKRKAESYTLRELAAAADVAPRTVRYYIARELLPAPAKRGRKAEYRRQHLERLTEIRKLQAEGLTLSAISASLAGARPKAKLAEPAEWLAYEIDDDVVVWLRGSASPWRRNHVREALGEFAEHVKA